jgi:hypothetical protein
MNSDRPDLCRAAEQKSVGPTSIPPRPPSSTVAKAEGLEVARDIEDIDDASRTITNDEPWRVSRTCVGVTSKIANAVTAGMVIGLTLADVHLIGIPLTGTSVNLARSLGPALVVGGTALNQVWLFIVAPLVGGALAALLHRILFPTVETL